MDMELKRGEDGEARGYARVFGFVRDQLIGGQLKAGDRLLPERELALKLGVSRPVVREVLRALAAIGVVEIRHGFGSIVRKPDFSELGEHFTMMLAQSADVDDIMEARIAIERQAIRLACRRATPDDLVALEVALRRIEETIGDPEAGSAADFAFHALLTAASHSPTLESLHAAISVLLRRSHRQRRERVSNLPGLFGYLVDHHRRILAAVARQDQEAADMLLMQHFEIGSALQQEAARSSLAAGSPGQNG